MAGLSATAEELAAVVKGCHAQLRRLMKSGQSTDELWQKHVSDRVGLRVYSEAMQQLATGPWAGKIDGGRISWCVQTCEEYLSYRLEQLLLKDLRRLGHGMPTLVEPSLLPTCPHGVRDLVYKLSSRALRLLDVGSCYNPFLSWPQFVVTAIDIAPATESVLECDFLSVDIVSMDGQLQEAPSYQPNQPGHEEGIDCTPHPPGTEHQQLLMPPGTEHQQLLMPLGTVHQLMPLGTEHQPMPPGMEHQLMPPGTEQLVDCRPGTVQCQPIKPPGTDMFVGSQQGTEQCTDHDAAVHLLSVRRGVARPVMVIHQLCGDYFHVVVFSLLLSYLPCTTQRLLCCINAHRVLQLHGLLLVVSPDSSHQNRHASLMVGWRHCIEAVGFHRWKYEKQTHLHCMAFRKTQPTREDYSAAKLHHALLSIPQDRQ